MARYRLPQLTFDFEDGEEGVPDMPFGFVLTIRGAVMHKAIDLDEPTLEHYVLDTHSSLRELFPEDEPMAEIVLRRLYRKEDK